MKSYLTYKQLLLFSSIIVMSIGENQIEIRKDQEDLDFLKNRIIGEYEKSGSRFNVDKAKNLCFR